jgi:hypothetical protein
MKNPSVTFGNHDSLSACAGGDLPANTARW